MKITVYTDGAARGNPGASASGFYAFDMMNNLLLKKTIYNGIKTNNYAEYNAIINALIDIGKNFGYNNEIVVYSDSQLVVRQVNGEYKVKDRSMKKLHDDLIAEASKFKNCRFVNVSRENIYISQVDKALNSFLDKLDLNQKGKGQ